MKLTRRQQEFITNLIDLNYEFEGPIHYSVLAERLGVSPFTAYDMLCLLEEKGLVTSEYQLAADKDGPGRTERLFYPRKITKEGDEELADKFAERLPDREELKQNVLSGIDTGEIWQEELADELLARVPDIKDGKISYCVEIMTIVVLRLQRGSGRKLLLDHLPRILPADNPTREDLSLLGGFAFGLLAQECMKDDEWIQKLIVHIQKYLSIVQQLNPQESDQLAEALIEIFPKFRAE